MLEIQEIAAPFERKTAHAFAHDALDMNLKDSCRRFHDGF
jgi:hypothetical protein